MLAEGDSINKVALFHPLAFLLYLPSTFIGFLKFLATSEFGGKRIMGK